MSGDWLASRAYTVTIPARTRSVGGDPLARDTVVRFTTASIEPWFSLRTRGLASSLEIDRARKARAQSSAAGGTPPTRG